jgi:hypothetical protein
VGKSMRKSLSVNLSELRGLKLAAHFGGFEQPSTSYALTRIIQSQSNIAVSEFRRKNYHAVSHRAAQQNF